MKPKYLALLNLLALTLLFLNFIPYNKEISAVFMLVVSMFLLLK